MGVLANGAMIVGDGTTDPVAESGATLRTSIGVGTLATQDSDAVNISGGAITGITDLAVADGGTGASSFTDGGVLLGSGTGAVTAMAVLSNGEMIVGDGSGDPVAESGATLRTSIGVGTGDSPQFTAVNIGASTDTTVARASAGDINVEGNLIYRAGGTDVPVADGGTGASTLAANGVLFGNDTSAVGATAVGSDGQILTSNGAGSAPTFQDAAAAGGGWEYVSVVTASNSATVAFTSMATGYDWKIVATNVLAISDGVDFGATLGISGPTYRTSNYQGAVSQVWYNGNATGADLSHDIAMSSTTIGAANVDEGLHIINLELYDPANASTDTTYTVFGQHSNIGNSKSILLTSGHYTDSEAHVAVSFQFSTGNISAGVFKLYKRANA
jgi:hypothetical protein